MKTSEESSSQSRLRDPLSVGRNSTSIADHRLDTSERKILRMQAQAAFNVGVLAAVASFLIKKLAPDSGLLKLKNHWLLSIDEAQYPEEPQEAKIR
jgi:hypothetical protein